MKRDVLWALAMVLVMSVAGILVSLAAAISTEEATTADDIRPALVYSAETDLRQYDIGLIVDGEQSYLTEDKLSHSPDWSPDGRRIAFVKGAPGSWQECCGYEPQAVWVMDANGENASQVSPAGIDPISGPEWTPDGQAVVFTVYSEDLRSGPQWTPDGQAVVFTIDGEELELTSSGTSLVRLNLANSTLITLVPDFPSREVSLSPDGENAAGVLWTEEVDPEFAMFRMDINTHDITTLGADVFPSPSGVKWSPDGEWIVFSGGMYNGRGGSLWAYDVSARSWVPVADRGKRVVGKMWLGPAELLVAYQASGQTEFAIAKLPAPKLGQEVVGTYPRVNFGEDFDAFVHEPALGLG